MAEQRSFTHHPDKEGTERALGRTLFRGAVSFTHHPDKEGTESSRMLLQRSNAARASHTIPIKRELKADMISPAASASQGFTHHPDKEGTERRSGRRPRRVLLMRFTHHPDKEGTESSDNPVARRRRDVLHTPSR